MGFFFTGLMGRWYDGCIGWMSTADRQRVFDFTDSYTQDGLALMTRKDSRLTALWNSGFYKIQDNGSFNKLCSKQKGQAEIAVFILRLIFRIEYYSLAQVYM